MAYVIAAFVVLLLAGGFITYMVLTATRRAGRRSPEDPGAEGHPAGIVAPDASPLGDSAEHAGDQREGRTVDEPEAERSTADPGAEKPRVGDPGPEASAPESERLANRSR